MCGHDYCLLIEKALEQLVISLRFIMIENIKFTVAAITASNF